jgi:hypothetical protein
MKNVYVADSFHFPIEFFPVGQSNGTTIVDVTNTPGIISNLLSASQVLLLDNQLHLYVADDGNQ